MPIYAYRCSTCGHAKDVLQKMSDPLLHTCPSCGAETFTKQVTAAGFQLKGSGWYVTDFKGGGAAPAAPAAGGETKDKPAASSDKPDSAGSDKKAGDKAADKPGSAPAAAPSPAPAPAASGGGSGGGSGGTSTPSAS